jgi:hypothetical protein
VTDQVTDATDSLVQLTRTKSSGLWIKEEEVQGGLARNGIKP